MQLNCGYVSSFTIVRCIYTSDVLRCDYKRTFLTRYLVLCISTLSKLKRGSTTEKRREYDDTSAIVTAAKPCELRLCFLSICARLPELFACIAAYINPPQDAFNDTDAPRISAQETRSKFRCYLKSFSYNLVTIILYNQLKDTDFS